MPDRATTAGYDVLYAVFSCRSSCHPARRCVIAITVRVWRQAARPCWTPSTEVKSTWPSSSSTLASMMSSTRETSTAKRHWYEQSTSRSWLSTLYVSRSVYLGQDLLSLYWHSRGCRLVKQESRVVARKQRDAARAFTKWLFRCYFDGAVGLWTELFTVTPTNDDIADPYAFPYNYTLSSKTAQHRAVKMRESEQFKSSSVSSLCIFICTVRIFAVQTASLQCFSLLNTRSSL